MCTGFVMKKIYEKEQIIFGRTSHPKKRGLMKKKIVIISCSNIL